MEKDLAGKTALVTGGGRGIGARIAERLARAGAIVAVNYAGNAAAAEETVAGILAEGGQAFLAQAKIGEPGEIEKLVSLLDTEFTIKTDLDILINNIGGGGYMTIRTTTVEQFERLFTLNIGGPFFLTQALLDRLSDNGGRVVNISSAASRLAGTDFIAYSILKAGVDMFTRVLAKDLGPRGITVNSVAPGFVKGDTYEELVPTREVEDQIRANTLLNRIGEPEEIADFVHALVGSAGRYATGQNIEVSGGFLF